MKKIVFALALCFGVLCTASLVSCGSDEDDPTEQDGGTGGNTGDGDESDGAFTPEAQKSKLESAALDFMQEYPADNFEEVSNLVEYLSEEYCGDEYDSHPIEEWLEVCMEEITKHTGTSNEKNEWGYDITYNHYTAIYAASNFKGSFEAKNGNWKYTESNTLQFKMKDADLNLCVIELIASGDTKKVYVSDTEDWDYQYDWENSSYSEIIDITENYIQVPENITITLTRSGRAMVTLNIKTDLSSMKGENYDLSKDRYSVRPSIVIGEYTLEYDKMKYVPEKGSGISCVMKRNNKLVFKIAVDADVDADNDDFYGCDNALLTIDLLGQVQIKGKCSNIVQYNKYLDEAEENSDKESAFKENINKANKLMDLGLYYDNRDKKYANVELKCFEESYNDYYYNYSWWTYTPVIVFADDDTSYAFDEFFNKDDFRKVIKTAERLLEDYSDMLEY
ncbi:MAG: hypothetical protein IKB11_02465 [Bacteroidaceae bacterium]|nr:hypothetical protein [Bacteroidaceae bacterium]